MLVCVCVYYFSLSTLLSSVSALMARAASRLSESKKETAPGLVRGSVLAYSPSPHLLPNLNSFYSEGHKSAVVRMYYEEINIYQIAFREGE